MGVVHVQVEHRPAQLGGIEIAGHPTGLGNDPLEMSAKQLPVFAADDRLIGEAVLGKEGQDVADLQDFSRRRGRLRHPLRIGRGQGDRLFAEDVLAGLQRGDGHGRVQGRGKANIDHVHVGVAEEFVQIGVLGDC